MKGRMQTGTETRGRRATWTWGAALLGSACMLLGGTSALADDAVAPADPGMQGAPLVVQSAVDNIMQAILDAPAPEAPKVQFRPEAHWSS